MSNNSAFSYDSPIMQILMHLGDLIILNFLFVLCSLPIFTIGAAHAGLYTGIKVLTDKEDDSSPAAAFFRGFSNGFLKVTLAWVILALVFIMTGVAAIFAYAYQSPLWPCLLPMFILGTFMASIPAFHSRFGCTAMQLIRNCWFLIFAHPIRSFAAALLFWLPLILLLTIQPVYFMATAPVLLTLYFSTAVLFGYKFLQKPFNTLIEEFNRRQEEANAQAGNDMSEAEEEDDSTNEYEPDELDIPVEENESEQESADTDNEEDEQPVAP